MNCLTCKVNKIGPSTAPYGGFLCGHDHLQCNACNTLAKGHCGICENETRFVQMNFNNCTETLAMEQNKFATSAVGQEPTAPPLLASNPNLLAMHQESSCFFPKSLFAEIETQSSLSQEHLSMRYSKDSFEKAVSKSIVEEAKSSKSTYESQEKSQPSSDVQISEGFKGEQLKNSNDEQKSHVESDANGTSHFAYSFHNVDTCNGLHDHIQSHDHHTKPDKKKHRHRRRTTSKEYGLNENIFLFEVDPSDSNIINTSEIRFMDSSDSLHNFYSNSTPNGTNITKQEELNKHFNDVDQSNALSTKVLHDFESLNTANRTEVVQNYLESYGPLGFYSFPANNCQHPFCDFGCQQHNQQLATQKKTVCVSTDSNPSLKNANAFKTTDKEASESGKFQPQEFVVMQSVGIVKRECDSMTLKDKLGRPSLDMRMQKILETFQEDPKIPKLKEKPLEQSKGNYMKIPFAAAVTLQQPAENSTSPRESTKAHITSDVREATYSTNNNVVVYQLLNSHRALYNPPEYVTQTELVAQELPAPQFQTIQCSSIVAQELMLVKSRFLNKKPVPAYTLNIPRSPIRCPQSNCQRMIFVSDFNKHLVVDHSHLPMERIEPFQCKNFFLDPRLAHCGVSKCHLLYLMRDTISDLGSSKYKDFLPLLVMTTRISLTQICGLEQEQQATEDRIEFFIIWVTGIVPEEFPISVSLTIWPRSGTIPSCHVVYSGEVYSIRKSQQALDVWQSGRMLLLSAQEIHLLTDGGSEMLNLQLVVH